MSKAPPDGATAPSVLDTLAAWREQGADRLDPTRFRIIEALARRAAAAQGDAARGVLEQRLAQRVQAYQRDVDAARVQPVEGHPDGGQPAATPGPESPLSAFIRELQATAARPAASAASAASAEDAAPSMAAASYPDLALLDFFRDTWGRYKTRRQLKQSEERVPENAGPLNSSLLVHRTLSLMREVSPEYLHQFLSYVDALAWVEQATSVDLLTDKDRARGGARKASRGPRSPG
ncbi:hypothetical protein CAL26_13150 [Bordetella genomosp. 9]|uniref:DUF2894 domain-containing protein n=1 Tax=Bordetella genomosp. 9 TaxID=1416803 RepID=A0A261R2U5_9BORD|nr:DUF2894 domain-containing protein [Bordetella genomosp. 9]OZI18653.1 hypothetical protein CAL26_13150 [Bordetella genomosp. 9]